MAAKKRTGWELTKGFLRIREWVRYFDPYKEISSLCQAVTVPSPQQVQITQYFRPEGEIQPKVTGGEEIVAVAAVGNAGYMESSGNLEQHPDVSAHLVLSSAQVVILDCTWNRLNFRVVVHGSNSHVERHQLWLDLLSNLDEYTIFLGDFNVVKGTHERIQAQISDEGYTDELFDKEVSAQATINVALSRKSSLLQQKIRIKWLNDGTETQLFSILLFGTSSVCALFLILRSLARCVMTKTLSVLILWTSSLVFLLRPPLFVLIERLYEDQNALLTRIPDLQEITAAVFYMDSSSSVGLDGFSGKFYQSCWEIIKQDVWKVARMFFLRSYLPVGCNSSTLILLPKKETVKTVMDLKPIVLSNFLFKIFSKILAKRLNLVVAQHVTPNQFGFISGRVSHDCTMLGSEGVN
ncbi:uncharacterized protein LOC131008121 [Salvia miltiorrhiza]|uniref:uncharacterized protein LOC131008121 n=1 Tax=Salvia miltiorrhiza TaxID=226208 RepID=UPI0025AC4A3A|nr:uncharacterized protein LOC131008121 [Salvia miltiorrhiza]